MRIPTFAIRGKIMATMASLLLVVLLVGGIALQKFNALNTTVRDITGNYLLSIGYLADMNAADMTIWRSVMELATLGKDTAVRDRAFQTIMENRTRRAKAEALYAPTVTTPQETELFRAYKEARTRTAARVDDTMALVRAGQFEEALAIYTAEVAPLFKIDEDVLARDIALNEKFR